MLFRPTEKTMTLRWDTDQRGNPTAVLTVRGVRPKTAVLGRITLADHLEGEPVGVLWGADPAEPEDHTEHPSLRAARAAVEAKARRVFASL